MDKHRRAQERKELNQVIAIHDIINGHALGELINISSNGLMLISEKLIETSSIFQLSLQLPATINGKDSIEIGVDCLWCRKAENFNRYWAGFQIIDVSQETSEIINILINNYSN
jgi:hypothetical protein